MNRESMKIGVALKEGRQADESWVDGIIDTARRSLRLQPLNVNVNVDAKVVTIHIDGREYSFMEECFDNDEATVKRIAAEIANQGIPVYYGDVYFRVPAIQHLFKKVVIMLASGQSVGDGYAITRSLVDMQCGIEFPTGSFSDNPSHVMFYSLGLVLPMAYSQFMQTITRKLSVTFPGTRFRTGTAMPAAESKFLEDFLVLSAKASKVYPIDMIWSDEVLPVAIQNMLVKVTVTPVSAFHLIDRGDATRLNISRYANRASILETEGQVNIAMSNMINNIGDLLQPRSNEDYADAMKTLLENVNDSRFRGRVNIEKMSPSQLIIEIDRNARQPRQPSLSSRRVHIEQNDIDDENDDENDDVDPNRI